eukprot:COSAG02_NODE_28185_length_594_cov_1.250505_1_plen_51_part_01
MSGKSTPPLERRVACCLVSACSFCANPVVPRVYVRNAVREAKKNKMPKDAM